MFGGSSVNDQKKAKGMNAQFMKILQQKDHLLHKVQEVLVPPT